MKEIIIAIFIAGLLVIAAEGKSTNLGGYDSTEPYNPTPTYDYYEYE